MLARRRDIKGRGRGGSCLEFDCDVALFAPSLRRGLQIRTMQRFQI
jgi:hypothetical protein